MPQYVRDGEELVKYRQEAIIPLTTSMETVVGLDHLRRVSSSRTWDQVAAAFAAYSQKEKRMFTPFDSMYKRHFEAAGELITELFGVPSRVDNITIENEWGFGKEQRSRITFDVSSHGWVHGLAKGFRPKPTKVIRHEPATVVFMEDGTKHVIKCHEGDKYDPDLGILNIFLRKCLSNRRFDVYEKAMKLILKAARKAKSLPAELRGIGNALLMAADAMELPEEK